MRWFARPEKDFLQLRVAPELDSWDRNDHPAAMRLRAYLDDTEALVADSKVQGPWALRLDVGRRPDRDLLDKADLDNYAYPLAKRLRDEDLVSVWCTKEHRAQSYVRLEAACEISAPADVLIVETTASWEIPRGGGGSPAQRQLIAAVAHARALPPGPVRLELSFVIGPLRTWPKLWKPTIDSLDALLGRTYVDQPRSPLDGRITELGLHLTVDPTAGNGVAIGIHATPGSIRVSPHSHVALGDPAWSEKTGSSFRGVNGPAHPDGSLAVHLRPTVVGEVDAARPKILAAGVWGGDAREFRNDDAGYLTWLAAHPTGYVINIGRSHSPAGARVHRARCGHMNRPSGGGTWTKGQYVKVCAPRLADLERWAAIVVRESIEPCRACNP